MADVIILCGQIHISTFNLPIQGEEDEQRRDLNGEDVDQTLAAKKTLLNLRSVSFILISFLNYHHL